MDGHPAIPPDRQPPPHRRTAPRPLPFHLMAQWTTLSASHTALPFWKSGFAFWNQRLAPEAEALKRDLDGIDAQAFEQALTAESARRIEGFLKGVEAYRAHPYHRSLPPVPVVWQEGTTRLYDYSLAGAQGPAVLVVPSLINRAYVLDLTKQRSFVRYLAEKGLRPYMVDWDAPGEVEAAFTLDDYIAGRLVRVAAAVEKMAGRPFVAGYCMGGLLALGLAAVAPARVRGLVLLATPWDFHRPSTVWARQIRSLAQPLSDVIDSNGILPADVLQILFASNDPGGVERKFRQFGSLPPKSARARNFVALEDWVNDCVPLAAAVARECLFGWYVDNATARGEWHLDGRPVVPATVAVPALAVVPMKDRIVPAHGALALAEAMPTARLRRVHAGHVGMMVGVRAKSDIYYPVVKWLIRQDASA